MIPKEIIAAQAMGRLLTRWREDAKLSFADLVRMSGVRTENLKNVEAGRGNVSTLLAYQLVMLQRKTVLGEVIMQQWGDILRKIGQRCDETYKAIMAWNALMEPDPKKEEELCVQLEQFFHSVFLIDDVNLVTPDLISFYGPHARVYYHLHLSYQRYMACVNLMSSELMDSVLPPKMDKFLFEHSIIIDDVYSRIVEVDKNDPNGLVKYSNGEIKRYVVRPLSDLKLLRFVFYDLIDLVAKREGEKARPFCDVISHVYLGRVKIEDAFNELCVLRQDKPQDDSRN